MLIMQNTLVPLAAFVASAAVVQAAEPAEICAKLCAALQQEVELLEGVKDEATAKDAVSPLRKSMEAQTELFSADDQELWEYIDNTDGVKQPLVELLQRLSCQFTRMEEVNFFNCDELRALLYDQILTDMEEAKDGEAP